MYFIHIWLFFRFFVAYETYFLYSSNPVGGVPHQKRLKALTGIELCLHYGFDTFLRKLLHSCKIGFFNESIKWLVRIPLGAENVSKQFVSMAYDSPLITKLIAFNL